MDYECENLLLKRGSAFPVFPRGNYVLLNRVRGNFGGKCVIFQSGPWERPESLQALQKCLWAHCARLPPAPTAPTAREPLDSTVELQETSA